MTPNEQIRLECLKLANSSHYEGSTTEIAQKFYDFVMGTNDAEILSAARDLADKVKQT